MSYSQLWYDTTIVSLKRAVIAYSHVTPSVISVFTTLTSLAYSQCNALAAIGLCYVVRAT